jgi:hypothetical protein
MSSLSYLLNSDDRNPTNAGSGSVDRLHFGLLSHGVLPRCMGGIQRQTRMLAIEIARARARVSLLHTVHEPAQRAAAEALAGFPSEAVAGILSLLVDYPQPGRFSGHIHKIVQGRWSITAAGIIDIRYPLESSCGMVDLSKPTGRRCLVAEIVRRKPIVGPARIARRITIGFARLIRPGDGEPSPSFPPSAYNDSFPKRFNPANP